MHNYFNTLDSGRNYVLLLIFFLSITSCSNKRDLQTSAQHFLSNAVIAHRGAWKKQNLPQNSMAALVHSFELGAAGVEFDLHLSLDGIPVAMHDHWFKGVDMEANKYDDLKKVELSNGEPVPTFDSFVKKGIKQNKTRLVAELKSSKKGKKRSMLLAEKVLKVVEKHHAQDWMIYISFDYDIIKKIIEIDPAAKTMYLTGDRSPEQLKQDGVWGMNYNHSVYKSKEHWIQEARRLGITTSAWTVNDEGSMKFLLDQNIDYITTDEPELLFDLLKQ